MGIFGLLWFNEENKELISEIIKVNKFGKENYDVVEKHYGEMLEKIHNELQSEKKN